MHWLLTTLLVVFATSLCLTMAVRAVALRWGIVDHPDGKRKLHKAPVPLWGGVAVYLAIVAGLLTVYCTSPDLSRQQIGFSTTLLLAAGGVCILGAVDDCWNLNSRLKLALQLVSVVPVVASGYYFDLISAFGHEFALGWLGPVFTVAWLVGCINALNLLDGMDGLASTVGLITAVVVAVVAAGWGNTHAAVIAVVLAGALAGFVPLNLPPAKIFLGDSGSMTIGLLIGVLSVEGAMKRPVTLAFAVPMIIMLLPMFDTFMALARRRLTGRRFDAADRQHIHHRLLERGLSQWQTLGVMVGLFLVSGVAAVTATLSRTEAVAWITAVTMTVWMVRVRLFGHHELELARRFIAHKWSELASRRSARFTDPAEQILSLAPAEQGQSGHDRDQPPKSKAA